MPRVVRSGNEPNQCRLAQICQHTATCMSRYQNRIQDIDSVFSPSSGLEKQEEKQNTGRTCPPLYIQEHTYVSVGWFPTTSGPSDCGNQLLGVHVDLHTPRCRCGNMEGHLGVKVLLEHGHPSTKHSRASPRSVSVFRRRRSRSLRFEALPLSTLGDAVPWWTYVTPEAACGQRSLIGRDEGKHVCMCDGRQ